MKQSLKKQPRLRQTQSKSLTLPEISIPQHTVLIAARVGGFWWLNWLHLKGQTTDTNLYRKDGTNKNESKVCRQVELTVDQTRGLTP
jgi:hypothetical protein